MTVRVQSQLAVVEFVRAAVATSCLLFVAACSAGRGGCGAGEKCGPPSLPDTTVHLSIGGKSSSATIGQTVRASARRGVPTQIALSIDRTKPSVNVSNVSLIVQGRTRAATPPGATGPSAHPTVLLDRKGFLRSSETLSGTWIPKAQDGTQTLTLNISLDLGNASTSWQIATITL